MHNIMHMWTMNEENSTAVNPVVLVNSAVSPVLSSLTKKVPLGILLLQLIQHTVMATGGELSGVTTDQLGESMASMRQGIRDEMVAMKHELFTE